jgi:protein-S-isoprenylcysteine O-methyltransferase Ste14
VSRADWTLVAAIYLPVTFSILGGILHGRLPRMFAACLLSVLWVIPTLWALQRVNERAGWWSFGPGGMPLELYLGWVVLWGILPPMVFPRLPLFWCAILMIATDLVGMPLCSAAVTLGPHWLAGEAAAAAVVLMPALCIARWTFEDRHLYGRAAMQVITSALIFLYFLPELAFVLKSSRGWAPLIGMNRVEWQLWMQGLLVLAIPGAGAVMEFAERGDGTPIPYDPPKRLVTSGIYRYCANPMQVCCGLTMLAWGVMLQNIWLVLGAGISFLFSAGIANWDEGQDLGARFGGDWKAYRAEVGNWLPRWRPFAAGPPAKLFIAGTCGPCSEVRAWLESRSPIGLEFVAAETLPMGSIQRLRYEAGDGSERVEGVRALGRALEHLNLGWAIVGTTLRLPLVWQFVQLLTDVSGLGPRVPA